MFLSEQVAYTRAQLERHQRHGDEEGPLAESGFRGHPECRFCKKKYYGENELYMHMHASHEECFLCRRAHPNRHVYYRDYNDLEDHFHREHFPCDQQDCLEKKFVVFATEQELKTHFAREHGHTLSRAERKAALTLPVSFRYRRDAEMASSRRPLHHQHGSASDLAAIAASGQAAVVIGGAASVPSHLTQGGRRAQDPQEGDGLGRVPESTSSASLSAADIALTEAEFPSMATSSSSGPVRGGRWAGRAPPQSEASRFAAEEFPALPGTSKAARKRASKAKKNAKDKVSQSSQGVREVHDMHGTGAQASNSKLRQEEVEWKPVISRPICKAPSTQELREPSSDDNDPTQRVDRKSSRSQPPSELQGRRALHQSNSSTSTGISEALKEANRVLIEKIKGKLSDPGQFQDFRRDSARWLAGEMDSQTYHASVVGLGLASLVTELASTCPDDGKRADLLRVHSSAFSDTTWTPTSRPGSWVPPEVAAEESRLAASASSWTCSNCTLINAPRSKICEACGHIRTGKRPMHASCWNAHRTRDLKADMASTAPDADNAVVSVEEEFPSLSLHSEGVANGGSLTSSFVGKLPSGEEDGTGSSRPPGSKGGGKSGKKKVAKSKSLQSFMRSTPAVHPQNVWKNPNLQGSWAAVGQLAAEERAVKDAWEKK